MNKLNKKNKQIKTYLVGGAVRDQILGIAPKDKDYVVAGASAVDMLEAGFIPVGKSFPVFIKKGSNDEYALARKEIKTGARHTDFQFLFDNSVSLKEDLERRDFTCNAIAYDEETGEYIDYYNGIENIRQKKLKAVNSKHFKEDPLRILRLCRLAAQLNFSVDSSTMELVHSMVLAKELENLSIERIWNEIEKALKSQHFYRFIETSYECRALCFILPEIVKFWTTPDKDNNSFIIEKVIKNLKAISKYNEFIKFAFLLYNLKQLPSDNSLDYAEVIKTICKRLKVPHDYRNFAVLVCNHYEDFIKIPTMTDEELLNLIDNFIKMPKNYLEDFISLCCVKVNFSEDSSQKKLAQKILRKAFKIISELRATDMPNFKTLKKNHTFANEYYKYKLQVLKNSRNTY